MDFTEVAILALQVVSPLLVAALAWVAARVANLIQSKVANEYLRGTLVRLDQAVFSAVKELQVTVVDEIKAASADGKIDDAEKARIKAAALENVKSYLGTKGLSVLAEVFGLSNGTVDQFLGSRIEAAVHDLRLAERATASMAPVAQPAGGASPLASSPT